MIYLKIVTDKLFSLPHTKSIALAVAIGCGLWIFSNFLSLFGLVFGKHDLDISKKNPTNVSAQKNTQLLQLHTWHLFGQMPPTVTNTAQIPISNLNLVLVGIFLRPKLAESRALITDANGKTQTYRIGDMIPGGVTLFNILPDSVLLKRGNELEKLKLPNRELNFAQPRAGVTRSDMSVDK
jgi:hypothetical protein